MAGTRNAWSPPSALNENSVPNDFISNFVTVECESHFGHTFAEVIHSRLNSVIYLWKTGSLKTSRFLSGLTLVPIVSSKIQLVDFAIYWTHICIAWKALWWRYQMENFPRYWPFVRGIHRWPVISPQKGQWRGALIFFFALRLNKRMSKQSWGWWLETPSRPLWRHCNEIIQKELGPCMWDMKVKIIQINFKTISWRN